MSRAPTPGRPSPFLRRPVSWPQALAVFGGVAVAWLGATGAVAVILYRHWEARIAVVDQDIGLRLPRGLPARAEVDREVPTHIDVHPRLAVPIDQSVSVAVRNTLAVRARIDTVVPIRTVFRYDTVMPFATTITTRAHIASWLPGFVVRVPIRMDVPVHFDVPIDAQLPLHLDARLRVSIPERLNVPLHATIRTVVPLRADLRARVRHVTEFSLEGPLTPWGLRVSRADVRLPLSDIGWDVADAAPPGSAPGLRRSTNEPVHP